MGVELGEPAPVEILQVGIGAGEREIDVVEHVGIGRARLARRARHQPLGERRDGARIVVVEEGAVAAAHRSHDMPRHDPWPGHPSPRGAGDCFWRARPEPTPWWQRRRRPARPGTHGGLHHALDVRLLLPCAPVPMRLCGKIGGARLGRVLRCAAASASRLCLLRVCDKPRTTHVSWRGNCGGCRASSAASARRPR